MCGHGSVQPVVVTAEPNVGVHVVSPHEETMLVFAPRDGGVDEPMHCETEPRAVTHLHVASTKYIDQRSVVLTRHETFYSYAQLHFRSQLLKMYNIHHIMEKSTNTVVPSIG